MISVVDMLTPTQPHQLHSTITHKPFDSAPHTLHDIPYINVTLSTLPDDILQQIFEYLSTYELLYICHSPVSKSLLNIWHRLYAYIIDLNNLSNSIQHTTGTQLRTHDVYHELIYKSIDCTELHTLKLQNFGRLCTDESIHAPLNKHCHTLNELSLCGNHLIQPYISCQLATTVDLSRNKYLTYPVIQCHQLYELDLSKTYINDLQINYIVNGDSTISNGNNVDMNNSVQYYSNLNILRLAYCKNIRTLNITLPQLTVLDLTSTNILDNSISYILQSCHKLSILSLDQCHSIRNPVLSTTSLTVLTMQQCSELRQPVLQCPNLIELDISSTNVRDSSFSIILGTLNELQRLSIRQCNQLNDPLLIAPLYKLHTIDCTNSTISSNGLNRLLFHSPNIVNLYAKQCMNINELPINNCNQLQNIVLKSTPVNDTNLSSFIQSAHNIQQLSVTNCSQVSGMTIHSLVLTYLDISCCELITDTVVYNLLSDQCPSLTYLNISFCSSLVDCIIPCNKLNELHISHCRSIETLDIACENIEQLDISTNLSLTQCTLHRVTSKLHTFNLCDLLPFVTHNIMLQLNAYHHILHSDLCINKQMTMSATTTPNSPYNFIKRKLRTNTNHNNHSLTIPSLILTDDDTDDTNNPTQPIPFNVNINDYNDTDNTTTAAAAATPPVPIRRHRRHPISPHHSLDSSTSNITSPPLTSESTTTTNTPLNSPTRHLMACQRASYHKRHTITSPSDIQSINSTNTSTSNTNDSINNKLLSSPTKLANNLLNYSNPVSPTRRSTLTMSSQQSTPRAARSLFTFDQPNLSSNTHNDTLSIPLPAIPVTTVPTSVSLSPRSMSVCNDDTAINHNHSLHTLQLKRSSSMVPQSTIRDTYIPKSFVCSIEIYVIQQRINMLQHRLNDKNTSTAVQYGLKKQLAVQKAKLRREEMAMRELEYNNAIDNDHHKQHKV